MPLNTKKNLDISAVLLVQIPEEVSPFLSSPSHQPVGSSNAQQLTRCLPRICRDSMGASCSLEPKVIHVTVPWIKDYQGGGFMAI